MNICNQQDCTGCLACFNACLNGAITLQEDMLGHLYPVVEQAKCSACSVCKAVCPSLNPLSENTPMATYAVWSKELSEQQSSASGGAAAAFSQSVIKDAGIVYGVSSRYQDGIKHIRVCSKDDLPLLKGSKYIQSMIENTYQKIHRDLEQNLPVLFIGTACQVAGLYRYLRKPYKNLITADLICHGVPSQKLLAEHLEKKVGTLQNKAISFRGKKGMSLQVFEDGRKVYSRANYRDLFYMGFLKGLFYRECCYCCKYAKQKRIADITLGDFWGLGKKEPFRHDISNGISLVLINTEVGQMFFDKCKTVLYHEKRSLQEAVEGNKNLRLPSSKHQKRDLFLTLYPQHGFDVAAKSALKKEFLILRIQHIKGKLMKSNQFRRMLCGFYRFKTRITHGGKTE